MVPWDFFVLFLGLELQTGNFLSCSLPLRSQQINERVYIYVGILAFSQERIHIFKAIFSLYVAQLHSCTGAHAYNTVWYLFDDKMHLISNTS